MRAKYGRILPCMATSELKDEKYTWIESEEDLEITIPFKVDFKVKGKDVQVEIKKQHLKVGLKGHPPIIDAETYDEIKTGSTYTWALNDNELIIQLEKIDKRKWGRPFTTLQPVESKPVKPKVDEGKLTTHQPVDTTAIDPQMSNLAIIPAGGNVEKASDSSENVKEEREKQLKIFKEKYPDIDFAKCIFADD